MFVYLRLIWMDRARAHLALPHWTSHHTFILNLLDGFHFFLSGGKTVSLLFKSKKCLPLSSYKCLYFKIGYFIYLSQKNSMCCMLYMYQKDQKKKSFFFFFLLKSFIGMFRSVHWNKGECCSFLEVPNKSKFKPEIVLSLFSVVYSKRLSHYPTCNRTVYLNNFSSINWQKLCEWFTCVCWAACCVIFTFLLPPEGD